jgi:hypothetical protein
MKEKSMKNRKTVLAFVLIAVLAVTACGQQYDPESDFRVEPVGGGKSVRITKYLGDKWTVRIPPLIQKLPVTDIGRVFSGNKNLTSVTIPNSVTSIVNDAFNGCTNLASITIPDSVTSIGEWAFTSCTSLTSITIPNSVIDIRQWAFGGCTSLTSISIPDSVTTIGWFAFTSCTSLTSVTIGNNVTTIGQNAFSFCRNLASVTIGNSVTTIEDYAFDQCTGLTSVTFQGTNLGNSSLFNGDLRKKYLAGGIGTYTRPNGESETWTKQN